MSQSSRNILRSSQIVGEIASYYGEKWAEYIMRPITNYGGNNDYARDDGGNDQAYESVNIVLERLEEYVSYWKTTIGGEVLLFDDGTVGDDVRTEIYLCTADSDQCLENHIGGIFDKTQSALVSQMIIPTVDIENGLMIKTDTLGELYDMDFIKIAGDKLQEILDANLELPKIGSNMDKAEFVIKLMDRQAKYILTGISKSKVILGHIARQHEKHIDVCMKWAEMILFSDGGDIVTHKYATSPKPKAAINEYNPILSKTMDNIEASVPIIIEKQLQYTDMWNLVEEIDNNEIQTEKYLNTAKELLENLKDGIRKQYLSGELENVGDQASNIIAYIGGSLSDRKNNATYDKFVELQQKLQLSALDGVYPHNIVGVASGLNGWRGDISVGYKTINNDIKISTEDMVNWKNYAPDALNGAE